MATTRLGLYGGPAQPYGAFAPKTTNVFSDRDLTTRLGLYGGPRGLYGAFSPKDASELEPEAEVSSGGVDRALLKRLQGRYWNFVQPPAPEPEADADAQSGEAPAPRPRTRPMFSPGVLADLPDGIDFSGTPKKPTRTRAEIERDLNEARLSNEAIYRAQYAMELAAYEMWYNNLMAQQNAVIALLLAD